MRILMIACLILAGCANNPGDLLGKPLDSAISLYGQPVAAVDNRGARQFYFEPEPKLEQKPTIAKELLNPDMPILSTNYKPETCTYMFNALWTGAYKEWKIHSFNQSPACEREKK